jgi:GTP:adenosylcobinamide-phosphate guanylyltransferase
MDALILAGGKSTDDPLSALTGGELKSMLPIAGKPMVQWVLDAISGAKSIDTVVLIGIEDASALKCSKPFFCMPDEGSLIGNMQQASKKLDEIHPQDSHVVSFSADIPAITSEIIDHLVGIYEKGEYDIYYGVVERRVMEKRFPGSKRTYIKIKKDEVCGGDLNSFSKRAVLKPDALWKELIKQRKNPLKQAAMIGIDSLLLLILGLIDLDQVADRVCRRMGITGKALKVPFAEVGMDVDKPFQFEMVQADLMR